MPIREYQREDGTTFEVIQKMSDEDLSVCPETGQKVTRLLSPSAFHLKGSGWYKTDYSRSGGSSNSGSNGSTREAASESKSDTSSDSSGSSESPSCNGKGPAGGCSACSSD
ncbi:MAG: zinc ribbon domain-containing protein [Bdellovibrionales bacterium]|nr:zinc ribbon domain-containing protein [Bdellovibrionales bacterium]